MPEKESRKKTDGIWLPKVSRRQFLKRLGITTGGAFVTTLSLLSACKRAEPTTGANPSTNVTGTTTPTSATQTTDTTPTPTTTPIPTSSITNTTVTTTTSNTGTKTAPTFSYTVPAAPPPLVPVPDTDCLIATDRLYTDYHVWVKLVSSDVVVMGIASTMVTLLGDPYDMTLPDVGLKLAKDDTYSTIGGWKIVADIFSPVSGVIVQVNEGLRPYLRGDKIQPIVSHPYTYGWIIAVQMSKPGELNDLLDPQGYLLSMSKGK